MGLRINTNIQSLSAQRMLTTNSENHRTSLEKMSSGNRINHASDDAAGLAISEKLKSEIRSMRQASRNAGDGVSMIQVAEGSMNEISNILLRLRELSIQGASDTIGDTERSFLHKEVEQLKSEINRISNSTEFDGTKLLNGSSKPLEIQVGTHNDPLNDRFVYESQGLSTTLGSLGLETIGTLTKESAQTNLAILDDAITHLTGNRATLGALQNRMQSTLNNLAVSRENLEAANSRIRDTDMAEESSNLTRQSILTQSAVAILSQANSVPQLALKLLG